MLPIFPAFKTLSLADQADVKAITGLFPPYSDFNFVSLWTYNVLDKIEISSLWGNLVVKFQSYTDDSFFYSFLGTAEVIKTINTLLNKAEVAGLADYLSLVPEVTITSVLPNLTQQFCVTADRDNFDYIGSLEEVVALDNSKFHDFHRIAKRFERRVSTFEIKVIDIGQPGIAAQVETLFTVWEESRHKKEEHEFKAIKRLLRDATYFENLVSVGIYVEEVLAAWETCEIINQDYAVGHYRKADAKYPGIFQFLEQQMALELVRRGIKYLNFEQDLGIPGLRHAKESMQPLSFLKKYTISRIAKS